MSESVIDREEFRSKKKNARAIVRMRELAEILEKEVGNKMKELRENNYTYKAIAEYIMKEDLVKSLSQNERNPISSDYLKSCVRYALKKILSEEEGKESKVKVLKESAKKRGWGYYSNLSKKAMEKRGQVSFPPEEINRIKELYNSSNMRKWISGWKNIADTINSEFYDWESIRNGKSVKDCYRRYKKPTSSQNPQGSHPTDPSATYEE